MGRTKYWKATLVEIFLRASCETSVLARSINGQPKAVGQFLEEKLLRAALLARNKSE
jgi:hypothetical protein